MKSLKCSLCKKIINNSGDLSIGQFIDYVVEGEIMKKLRPYHIDCFTKIKKNFKPKRLSWNMFHVVSFGVLNREVKFNLYSFIISPLIFLLIVVLKPNSLGFVILSPIFALLYIIAIHHPLLNLYNIYKIKFFLKTP